MALSLRDTTTVAADPEAVSCELGAGAAILDLRTGTYFSLNSVGAFVWNLLESPRSVSELREAVQERYDVAEEQCRADIERLVGELEKASLVRVSDGAPA